MDDGVDSCDLIFTGDTEAHGLLNREAQDQSNHERVGQHREGCDGLHCELTEAATGEQAGVNCEEPEIERSHKTGNQVNAHNIQRVVVAKLELQVDRERRENASNDAK